jgi:hypothetical protein
VKRDPFDVIKQHQPTRDQQFAEVVDIDSFLLVPLEIYPGFDEQIYRVGRVHVITAGQLLYPKGLMVPHKALSGYGKQSGRLQARKSLSPVKLLRTPRQPPADSP